MRRGSIGFAALCLSLTACGGAESAPARPVPEPAPAEAPSPGPPPPAGEPVAISAPAFDARLEMHDGALAVTITEAMNEDGSDTPPPVRCEEAARGDLAPYAGDEVVWRCFERDMQSMPFALAVTAGDAVLWSVSEFPFPDCYPESTPVDVVDAAPGAPRELRVRVLGCDWTGAMSDTDWIYAWREDSLHRVVEARIGCDYMGDTSDGDAPEPPENETWICGGQVLELGGSPDAPTVTRIDVEQGVFAHAHRGEGETLLLGPQREAADGPEPLRDTDLRRTVMVWDASASRFEP